MNEIEIIVPKESNWYGYCNLHDYQPKTGIFELLNTVFVKKGVESLKGAIEYLSQINSRVDYKDFTEFIVIINLMSWDMYSLYEKTKEKPFEMAAEYLSDTYYKLQDEFYSIHKDNDEAKSYFFEMTD